MRMILQIFLNGVMVDDLNDIVRRNMLRVRYLMIDQDVFGFCEDIVIDLRTGGRILNVNNLLSEDHSSKARSSLHVGH